MNNLIKKAFTLIELLVVIAIVGILSGLIVITMGGVTQKATVAKAQVFSNSLRNSLIMNLISEWRLDENAGTTTADSWSGGNVGVLTGPTTLPVWKTGSDCINSSCLQFDGTDDYVNFPYSANLSPTAAITFTLWTYRSNWSAYTTDAHLLSKTQSGGYQLSVNEPNYGAGYLAAILKRNGNYASVKKSLSNISNGWHYFSATYDGRYFKLYVDGNLEDTNDAGGNYLIQYSYNNSLMLGAEPGSASACEGSYFSGTIDDVRLYDASIPVSQIKEQYYAGLNKLLANGAIDSAEYYSRIKEISSIDF
jgi:prepilin-type N-terminal cleavage/methylation domain-containing protein